ncbi:MAG: DUF3137 domain-containing protein [Saprospiraceae bacterium]|nr:DUF3137 domain-containing protein [Saprospiraceae bacterium]
MTGQQDFRLFYNQSIYPELRHLELRRRRLLRLLGLSIVMLAGIFALEIYMHIFVLTMALFIPVGLWIAYLLFRVKVYYDEFKPRIVGLVLDFIDNDINFGELHYETRGSLSKDQFLAGRIFTGADEYEGEDYIRGQIREMPFEASELRIREFSPSRDRLDEVFNGLFLIGDYRRQDMRGGVLLLPDTQRKYLSRSERAFHLLGGRRVRENLLPEFEACYDTYATPDVRIADVVSEDLQLAILRFRLRFQQASRKKEIYLSIIGDKLYVALSQDRNLLEPSLWINTVSFDVAQEFYEDLRLLFDIVLELDVLN